MNFLFAANIISFNGICAAGYLNFIQKF